MKTKLWIITFLWVGIILAKPASASSEEREVPTFSEVSLRISGNLYIEQGDKQQVRIVAKASTLDEIITEVTGRTLVVRFPAGNIFKQSFNPGKVDVYVTVPEIHSLSVSGSGDIIANSSIKSRILDLTVSGSGNINLNEVDSDRLKATISGSGDIILKKGKATSEFTVAVSGSGDIEAENLEAKIVDVKMVGSGNCNVHAAEFLKARVAGSGSVRYKGDPTIDSSILGSGRVKKL